MLISSSPRAPEAGYAVLGAVLGALGVAAGAFGTHALQGTLPETGLRIFETAARYQMFHSVALVSLGLAQFGAGAPAARWAARLFAAGTFLFSGSLYALALTGERAWGLLTPFGGVAWIVAWVLLAAAAWRARS